MEKVNTTPVRDKMEERDKMKKIIGEARARKKFETTPDVE